MAQSEMESGSAVPEANWGSYQSQIQNEESEIVAQFLTPYPPYQNEPESQDLGLSRPSSIFWPDQHANSYYYNGNSNNYNMCYWSQSQGESSNSSSNNNYLASHPENYENYYLNEPNVALEMNTISAPVDFNLVDEQNKSKSIHLVPNPSFGDQAMNEENCDENGNVSPNESDSSAKRKFLGTLDGAKKKVRSSTHVQKNENKPSSKKVKNNTKNGEDELENNGAINKQSPSSCDSDNDSNGSPENNASGVTSRSSKGNAAANLNGKGRAGRGSATDPQSLYARKRRERINERLKVLQSLVPNGTKVDISTMLEEAVQYVKFLQVQIKLLSNDEMWMYAPIAYNGMSLGIDLKISPPQ